MDSIIIKRAGVILLIFLYIFDISFIFLPEILRNRVWFLGYRFYTISIDIIVFGTYFKKNVQ